MSTGRKVFHCAVDETALTTNISEIKKWTTSGAIDLVVPLYSRSSYFGLLLWLLAILEGGDLGSPISLIADPFLF